MVRWKPATDISLDNDSTIRVDIWSNGSGELLCKVFMAAWESQWMTILEKEMLVVNSSSNVRWMAPILPEWNTHDQ